MKETIVIFSIILILILFFFSSCGIKRTKGYDFSQFPVGTILSGETKSGKTFYFIREEVNSMGGICFFDNNQAVAERIFFISDSSGKTNFIYENNTFKGKLTVKQKFKEIKLTLPKISALDISSQTIRLKYFGNISEKVTCDEHFKNPVFEKIKSEKDIQYGSALGYYNSKPSDYISKEDYKKWFSEMLTISLQHNGFLFKGDMKQLPLKLDIYQPENDNIKKRPLLLFIHGGAFIFGDKENNIQQAITDDLVAKGFVVSSINYRLGTSITPGSIERTIYRDVQDTRAALRYLVHNKEKYRIDPDQIYIAGSSAGGIISLTTAYMDNNEVYSSAGRGLFRQREDLGGLDNSGNELKENFNIAGVASMWGGITNLEMLNNNIPTLLFHGTNDQVVPNTEGLPFKDFMGNFIHGILSSFGKIYGSEKVFQHLKSLNVPVKYVPFQNEGHDPCTNPDGTTNAYMDIIVNELGKFLYDNVSKHYFNGRISGNSTVKKQNPTPVYKVENIEDATVQWFVEGGLIINQTNQTVKVIWYSPDSGKITTCITDKNGISYKKEYNVKINQD